LMTGHLSNKLVPSRHRAAGAEADRRGGHGAEKRLVAERGALERSEARRAADAERKTELMVKVERRMSPTENRDGAVSVDRF
jgi:hypothetical protein